MRRSAFASESLRLFDDLFGTRLQGLIVENGVSAVQGGRRVRGQRVGAQAMDARSGARAAISGPFDGGKALRRAIDTDQNDFGRTHDVLLVVAVTYIVPYFNDPRKPNPRTNSDPRSP